MTGQFMGRAPAAKRACADPAPSPGDRAPGSFETSGLSSRIVLWVAFASGFVTSATAGLTYVGSGAGWMEYLTAVSGIALLVMVLPGVMLGAVLPYLLRVVQAANPQPGPAIGGLVAANTSGAILGSLVAGFRWPAARLRGVSNPGLPTYTQGHLCPCTAASRGTETADRRHRSGLGASLPWAAPMAGECKGCSLDPR